VVVSRKNTLTEECIKYRNDMLKIIISILIILFELIPSGLFGCTVITKSDHHTTLVGMNVDWFLSD